MEFISDGSSDKRAGARIAPGLRRCFNFALILSVHSHRDAGASRPRCVLIHEKTPYIVVTARSLSGRYRGGFFHRKRFVEQPSNDLAVLSDAESALSTTRL